MQSAANGSWSQTWYVNSPVAAGVQVFQLSARSAVGFCLKEKKQHVSCLAAGHILATVGTSNLKLGSKENCWIIANSRNTFAVLGNGFNGACVQILVRCQTDFVQHTIMLIVSS